MKSSPLRRLLLLAIIVIVGVLVRVSLPVATDHGPSPYPAKEAGLSVEEAARRQLSEVMLTAAGRVRNTLADDNEGSRHQRFILETDGGHTVLVAHNIDLAPRVPLASGDRVEVHGQFEWNERGGVLHWTHHDPAGRHEAGWISHEGSKYE